MSRKKSSDIPEDAVIFSSEREAAAYIWDIVYEWKPLSQSWALRYGPIILGGINAVCGLIINKHYRTKFKLRTLGTLSTGLPIFVMPALLTTLFHNYLVPTDMLLMKSEPCPVCYEIKSMVIQCGFGLVYPIILAPAATLMLANRYSTCRVPDLSEGPKVMFNFVRKHSKPLSGTLVYMAAIQIAAASIITYFQMKNNHVIKQKLHEIEKKIDAIQEEKKTLKRMS